VTAGALRLAVAWDDPADGAWLVRLDYAAADATPIVLALDGRDHSLERDDSDARDVVRVPAVETARGAQPDFAALSDALDRIAPDACLLAGDGLFTSLVRVAADQLGLAVFTLVESEAQFLAMGRRVKTRADLTFLADRALLPLSQTDPRYGATVLPIGHPGFDPALGAPRGVAPASSRASAEGAGARLVDAIGRWRAGALDAGTPDLSVVVPAYNEEQNIALVCDRLLAALDGVSAEILVVDDASRDGTFGAAQDQMWRSSRIRAFSKPLPRGIGNGIRYGMDRARAPFIAITMGDGSDEVSKLPEMLRRVRDEGYGLAIGSRYRHRANFQAVPRLYRFWSAIFRLTTRVFIGFRLSDYTNAFRVFDRRIFERYGPESGGFEISPEITFKAWFATKRVVEVDVKHLKRASGQSSFSFLRAGPGYGKMLIKAFVQRLTGKWFVLDW
jgi:hypothetical protein